MKAREGVSVQQGFWRSLPLAWATGAVLLLGSACQLASPPAAPTVDQGTATALAQEEAKLTLVWEAWSKIEEAYRGEDTLHQERAVEGAILGMLDVAELHPYPFLTQLHTVTGQSPRDVPGGLEDIWRAWSLLRQKKADASPEKMVQAAARGLTAGLDDPHAGFMTEKEYAEILQDKSGEYEGIGAYVGLVDDWVTITQPIPGGPAERVGLQAGDRVVAVEGASVEGLSLAEVVGRIRGPKGTSVRLEVQRSGQEAPLPFVLTRGLVDVPSVEFRDLPSNVWYAYVAEFADDTGEEFKNALREALEKGMEGLVLDLRGNPGGGIPPAVQVTSQFLDGGLVMYEAGKEQNRKDWTVEAGGLALNLPLAVIVNDGTASAAEVVAGALKDRGRARLFGEKTYGKGAVQVYRVLSDGSAVRVTKDYWYTPSGQQFHGVGITPDQKVALSRQVRVLRIPSAGRSVGIDSQLEAAYAHVLSLLGRSLGDVGK